MKKIKLVNHVLYNHVYYITSDYKTRNLNRLSHNGMDLIGKNKSTDYVISIDDGVVITSTYSKSAGYYLEIRHENGYISRYLHLKKGSLKVKKNNHVNKGDIIAYMGSTGNSTGAHLHFAVMNQHRKVLDPLPYLLNEKNFKINNSPYIKFLTSVQDILGVKNKGLVNQETFNKTITISAKKNRKHKLVKPIQEYLYSLGYTVVGKADSIAGPKFTKAVKEFQRYNNCVVDGEITRKNKTWRKLFKY